MAASLAFSFNMMLFCPGQLLFCQLLIVNFKSLFYLAVAVTITAHSAFGLLLLLLLAASVVIGYLLHFPGEVCLFTLLLLPHADET